MAFRVGVCTQTPLLRMPPVARAMPPIVAMADPQTHVTFPEPPLEPEGGGGRGVEAGRIPTWQLADLDVSPGGVSRMVLQSVRAWHATGRVSGVHWFSLQPNGPPRVRLGDAGIDIHHLRLPPQELKAYARTKERLWADLHGIDRPTFDREDFRFYARYNAISSDAILAEVPDLDVAYVHDFQLLQVGAIVGLAAPCVLRWHVPFPAQQLPATTRRFLLRMMGAYDGVIVSTRRELETLTNAGFRGRIKQVYPHTDPKDWQAAEAGAVQELEDRFGLAGKRVVLCVARMDPIKRQDLLIAAMRRVARRYPDAVLLLVGNGSFSAKGGLGLSKSSVWKDTLVRQAAAAGMAQRVIFAGWMPDRLVVAAYARCEVAVLPSDVEGFGLVAYEAWAAGKPCIVTDGCGAAEVVADGVSGLVVPAGHGEALGKAIARVLGDTEEAARMGEAGAVTLRAHHVDRAADDEAAFLEEAIARAGRE